MAGKAGGRPGQPWPAVAGPRDPCLLTAAGGDASAKPWAPLWNKPSAQPCTYACIIIMCMHVPGAHELADASPEPVPMV